MNSIFHKFLSRVMPFIILGTFLVLLAVGIMLMVHLLILGALVGLVLFGIALVKEKLFPPHHLTRHDRINRQDDREQRRSGRTIDHDDLS